MAVDIGTGTGRDFAVHLKELPGFMRIIIDIPRGDAAAGLPDAGTSGTVADIPEPEEAQDGFADYDYDNSWDGWDCDMEDMPPEPEPEPEPEPGITPEEEAARLAWDTERLLAIGPEETCRRIAPVVRSGRLEAVIREAGYMCLDDLMEFATERIKNAAANAAVMAAREAFPQRQERGE